MKVLVLGAGPAGIFATHAAALFHADVVVAGINRKSQLYGCQYLHEPIPNTGLRDLEERKVTYELIGNAADYRSKVYGPSYGGSVSPEDLPEEHSAWDLRSTYRYLFHHYRGAIQQVYFEDSYQVGGFVEKFKPDLTFSSIPASVLCRNGDHTFNAQEIWAVGDAPDQGIYAPISMGDDHVICDGTRNTSWYRAARVFGHTTVEWAGKKPPIEGAARVLKPIRNNCDCLPGIIRIGRYGLWEKGWLSHTAFFVAQEKMSEWLATH